MLLMMSWLLRDIELMPRVASVPSTVAMTLETSASTRLSPSAERIISLWNRLLYQPRVKPVKFERDLLSLKLNAIMTAMGRYMKQNTIIT